MSDPKDASKASPETEALTADLGEMVAEFASENAIELGTDKALTARLARVAPPNQIPETVYSGVASLLAFLRDAEEEAGQ